MATVKDLDFLYAKLSGDTNNLLIKAIEEEMKDDEEPADKEE